MPSSFTFDIETIPQDWEDLSDIQKEELERLTKNQLKRFEGEKTEDEVSQLIRSVNPFFGKILCIGAHQWFNSPANGDQESTNVFWGDEKELLERFFKTIATFKGPFVHFNGLEFDVPFIIKRAVAHNIEPTNEDFLNLRRYSKWPHYDLMKQVAHWDRFSAPTLHLLADLVGVPSPKTGDIKGSDVWDEYQKGNAQKIYEYCQRDVECTFRIYKKIRKWY